MYMFSNMTFNSFIVCHRIITCLVLVDQIYTNGSLIIISLEKLQLGLTTTFSLYDFSEIVSCPCTHSYKETLPYAILFERK